MIATGNYYYIYFIVKYANQNTWLGRFYAAETTDGDVITPRYHIPRNISGSMTEVHARNHSYVLYTTMNSTILGYVMLDWTQDDPIWTLYYNCTRDD